MDILTVNESICPSLLIVNVSYKSKFFCLHVYGHHIAVIVFRKEGSAQIEMIRIHTFHKSYRLVVRYIV